MKTPSAGPGVVTATGMSLVAPNLRGGITRPSVLLGTPALGQAGDQPPCVDVRIGWEPTYNCANALPALAVPVLAWCLFALPALAQEQPRSIAEFMVMTVCTDPSGTIRSGVAPTDAAWGFILGDAGPTGIVSFA